MPRRQMSEWEPGDYLYPRGPVTPPIMSIKGEGGFAQRCQAHRVVDLDNWIRNGSITDLDGEPIKRTEVLD